ncbi:hypothetical protein M0638_06135 [Roseomonas sp. NAR14]|uniref:Uncharacterized protein n=1 Tax=Roseomonas acroporae TaxID=2937791 RepID=A0A9X2BT80_9PROT|nr:hypothetical protein [Roseomonas acroporae]MCK8783957.1 hypothetical protein [Roseomonas acroporae]
MALPTPPPLRGSRDWALWLAVTMLSYPLVVALGAIAARVLERLHLVSLSDPALDALPWVALPLWCALCLLLQWLRVWPAPARWAPLARGVLERGAAVLLTGLAALLGGLLAVGAVLSVLGGGAGLLWYGLRQLF